jgi:hypothetical protein
MKRLPKKRTIFWIAKDQLRALRALAGKTGAPVAAQVRIAIDEYLKKRSQKKAR